MHTNLRKVGGSVMLAVSPVFLKELKIACGSTVDVALVEGQLVVRPVTKPQYALADLLASFLSMISEYLTSGLLSPITKYEMP